MAPQGGGKRKRPYNNDSNTNDGSNRPSPHRPDNLAMAQHGQFGQHQVQHNQNHNYNQNNGGRGGRRGSGGGGRGGGQRGGANGSYGHQEAARQGGEREDGSGSNQNNSATPQPARQAKASPPLRVDEHTGTSRPPPGQPVELPAVAPMPTTSTPAVSAQPLESLGYVAPYDYEILTDEKVSGWKNGGQAAVAAEAAQAYEVEDFIRISVIFQELLRAGLDAKIDAVEAGKVVSDILTAAPADSAIDGPALFLDTLSILTDSDASNPRIPPLVTSTGISPSLMREQLDESMLQVLGLVRSTFGRVFIRKQTGILYRQSNYNLLREETEGYSKLVTELFTTTDTEPPTAEVAGATFEHMKALIGAFDLDAGRVLDVTLDVFATLLVKHYKFFVKLLRYSSWWPQEQGFETGNVQSQSFGGLPIWAQPDHSSWAWEDGEKEELMNLKEQRDKAFWDRAREVGINAFFELGGRRLVGEDEIPEPAEDAQPGDVRAAELAETRNWIRTTRTLPPSGNSVAAQLLGFKLRFYSSEARDAQDNLPMNLIYLSALLIKIGFISLRDLYPHLYPLDDSMEAVKEKQMKEKEERERAKRPGGGALNALARAGALADDTPGSSTSRLRDMDTRAGTPSKSDPVTSKTGTPSVKAEEEEKEKLPEPSDQKVQLLRSLLCIGAIPEAMYMLGRFTWLPNAFPDLPDHIHRILHHSISKVYDPLNPLRDRDSVRAAARPASLDQTGVAKGEIRRLDPLPPKVLRWAQLDKNDVLEGTDYRFYWDDWADNVPICQSVDDVITLCNTFLNLSGVKIGLDTTLLMKLARIGKFSLREDSSDMNRGRWFDLCKRLLCPALSLTKTNPGVVNEVYELLKFYPTHMRFSVYAEWFTGQISRLPDIQAAFALAGAETRDVLKRMSADDMKSMARTLARTACASPGIAFAVVLNQIESYTNLVNVVVECGRYFTYMGYDVLTWQLVNTLGRAGRNRIANDGINASGWLASLSTFCGRVFKRYAVMNPLPILLYVLDQLQQNNTTDLLVLRELIKTMAGIAPDTDFTDAQVQAMAGGELLQAQTLRQVHDKRHENKISGRRLMKTLLENGMAAPLLISIAQQRQMCIFSDEVELKIVSENYDDIQLIMTQYLDMVRNNMSIDDFEALMPDVASLIHDYGLDPSVAFTIHRKGIARAIEQYDAAHPKSNPRRRSSAIKIKRAAVADLDQSVLVVGGGTTRSPEQVSTGESSTIRNDEEIVDAINSEVAQAVEDMDTDGSTAPSPWHPVLEDQMSKLQPVLPEEFQRNMSLSFFVTFWQLSLHDLMAPYNSYTEEDNRQKEKIAAINAERIDPNPNAKQKKDQEKKAIGDFQRRLVEEMKSHLANYSHVRERLEIEKKHWFKDFSARSKVLNDSILQDCFLPRLLTSPLDSFFTWKILNMLHSSGTPGFRTMHFIDRLMSEKLLTNIIFQCTVKEADHLGRFLNEVLKEMSLWHADRTVYEKRAFGAKKELPGFAQTITKDGTLERFLDYEDFRRLLHKWHRNLLEALKAGLNNGEWKHVMNSIMVSQKVCRYFPAIGWMATKLREAIEPHTRAGPNGRAPERADLWVASNALLGNLKAYEEKWVLPQAFYINDAITKHLKAPSDSTSVAPTPAPATPANETAPAISTEASGLNVSAPEFVPSTVSITNGEQSQPVASRGEADSSDGEVEDVEMVAPRVSSPPVIPTGSAAAPSNPADLKTRVLASMEERKRLQSVTSTADTHITTASTTRSHAPAATPQSLAASESLPASRPLNTRSRDEIRSTPELRIPQPHPSVPARPEISRSMSNSRTQDPANHTLPNRPQGAPTQNGRYHGRSESDNFPPPPAGRYDSRTNGVYDGGRLDRPNELIQQRTDDRRIASPARLDEPANDNRGGLQDRFRDQQRANDHPPRQFAPELSGRMPPRDQGDGSRDTTFGRPPTNTHPRQEPRGLHAARFDMGDQSRQNNQTTSSFSGPPPQNSGVSINPARAALIAEPELPPIPSYDRGAGSYRDQDARRERFGRSQGQEFGERRPPNNNMPPPNDPVSHRVDLGPQRPPFETRPPNRDYSADQAPTGPRSGPPSRHVSNEEVSGRPDHRQQQQQQQPPFAQPFIDRGPNRLSQDFASQRMPSTRYQDANYGRLNTEPDSSTVPSNQGQLRSSHGLGHPQQQAERRQSNGSASGPMVQQSEQGKHPPPNYTSNVRQERQFDNVQNAAPTVPPVPAPPPPPPPPPAVASRADPPDLSGVHPSRLQQLGIDLSARPPPLQTSLPPVYPPTASPASSGPPPLGPRSGQVRQPPGDTTGPSPVQPSPSSIRGTPTGPAGAIDRRSNAAHARRFAGLNETLQKGGQPPNGLLPNAMDRNNNDRGTSIRGRATQASSRQNSFHHTDSPNTIPLPMANSDFDRRGPPQPLQPPQHQRQSQVFPPERLDPQRRDPSGRNPREEYDQTISREPRDTRDHLGGDGGSGRHRTSAEHSREHTGRGSDRDNRSVRGGDEGRERDGRPTRSTRAPHGAVPSGGGESNRDAGARRPRDQLAGEGHHGAPRERDGGSGGREREPRDRGSERGDRGVGGVGVPAERDVRGDNRPRDHARDDHGYHSRRPPGGNGAMSDMNAAPGGGVGGGPQADRGGRRDNGGDNGRRMGGDGRKRGWGGDDGGAGEGNKRVRRGGGM